MKALIDSKEIQVDDIPIILFSSVFDEISQKFSYRFQDFKRISDTTRLAAYSRLVETETAPFNFQMEVVELKNDEQFVKKFKDEEDLLDTCRGTVQYPNLLYKNWPEKISFFLEALTSGMRTTTHDIQRAT